MRANYGKAEEVKYDQLRLAANPRSLESISQESIRELGEDIIDQGITDRLRVRVAPDGSLEVWDGQRRFMGIGWAMELQAEGRETAVDLTMVPVINDGPMTDAEMLERQMHGFVQRAELSPLDEARGFERLRIEFGRSAAEISRAIGRNQEFVSSRLGLLRVPKRAWKAYEAHRLTIPHLALIGSLPLEADREQFTKEILAGEDGLPLTLVQARELKARAYGVALNNPRPLFDRDDAKLVPVQWKGDERVGGGACNAECPFYGGSDKNPMCGNVGCYDKKQRLAWSALKSNAIDNGKRWMDVDASSQLFTKGPKLELSEDCGFIDLAARLGFQDTGNYDTKHPVWGDLLEDTDGLKKSVTTLHPNGKKVYQLLEREVAIKLAVERDPALEALFAKRPGVKEATKVKVIEREDEEEVLVPVVDQSEPVLEPVVETRKDGETLSRYALEVEAFFAHAKAGTDVEAMLQMVFEAAVSTMTLDAMRVALAAMGGESLDGSEEWSRDACQRMLCGAAGDIDLRLFTVLVTSLRMRGHEPVTLAMQELLKLDCPKVEETEELTSRLVEEQATSDRAKAWVLFVQGMGKGTIAKELGISENTVGAWQKRDWPRRDDLNRFLEWRDLPTMDAVPDKKCWPAKGATWRPAGVADEIMGDVSPEVVEAWLEANPAK